MKIGNSLLTLLVILCVLNLFQSCEKSSSNTSLKSITNESIQGQAIIGNSNSSVNYSPKGNFIQVIKPESGIWKQLIVQKSNSLIEPKLFFKDDDHLNVSFIYDNLSFGEYQIKYISELKDTVRETLNFKKSIKLEFSKKLNDFYEESKIKDLDIKNFTETDTLQLLYQSYGCFGGSETLIEFSFFSDSLMSYRKNVNGLTFIDVPENEWLKSNNKFNRKKLTDFISKAKNLVNTDLDLCTGDMNYIFRIKGTNIISIIEDKSCELMNEIGEILKE